MDSLGNDTMCHKIKLLFVITKSNWGGAQRYVYDLATNMSRQCFEIRVAFGGQGEKGESSGLLEMKLGNAGIPTIFIKRFMRDVSIMDDLCALVELIRTFKDERPDIVHLNSPKAALLGVLAGQFARCLTGSPTQLVVTMHGWPFNEPRPALARAASYVASWAIALLCDTLILVSKEDERQAHAMPWCARKSHFVQLGIEHPQIPGNGEREKWRRDLIERSGFLNDEDTTYQCRVAQFETRKCIFTIAELIHNKGLQYAIEAISHLGDEYIYFIVGEGELRDELGEMIMKMGLADRIFLLGFVSSAAKYLWIRSAWNCFLLPSIKEGMPYVLLEASAAGLPIVATDVGGIRKFLEGYAYSRCIKPGDSVAIKESILSLENEGKQNYSFSREKSLPSLDRMIKETAEYYTHGYRCITRS